MPARLRADYDGRAAIPFAPLPAATAARGSHKARLIARSMVEQDAAPARDRIIIRPRQKHTPDERQR